MTLLSDKIRRQGAEAHRGIPISEVCVQLYEECEQHKATNKRLSRRLQVAESAAAANWAKASDGSLSRRLLRWACTRYREALERIRDRDSTIEEARVTAAVAMSPRGTIRDDVEEAGCQ